MLKKYTFKQILCIKYHQIQFVFQNTTIARFPKNSDTTSSSCAAPSSQKSKRINFHEEFAREEKKRFTETISKIDAFQNKHVVVGRGQATPCPVHGGIFFLNSDQLVDCFLYMHTKKKIPTHQRVRPPCEI